MSDFKKLQERNVLQLMVFLVTKMYDQRTEGKKNPFDLWLEEP